MPRWNNKNCGFQRGKSPWNKDKKGIYSKDTIIKMRLAKLGKKQSKEFIEKRIAPLRGRKLSPLSEERKRKISEAGKKAKHNYWLGKKRTFKNPEERNRKISESSKGRIVSEETRKKNSERQKGIPRFNQRGEKNGNYKGGITPESQKIRHSLEIKLWRDSVFARDGYTCQKTGIRGNKLVAHHIQNFAQYPELRTAIDNGITFSKESHIAFHKRYGKKNNTQEQITEFLSKL